MSVARITTHRSLFPGRYAVRYGTPSSFDFLGYVEKDDGWSALDSDGRLTGRYGTKTAAVRHLVRLANITREIQP